MVEVKANTSITSITVTMTEQEAGLLKMMMYRAFLWDAPASVPQSATATLAEDLYSSLEALGIKTSNVQLVYDQQFGGFKQEVRA